MSQSPESVAGEAVVVAAHHVELRAPGEPPVHVCGHPNPAVVRDQADAIRRFLAAVIRADRGGRPEQPPPSPPPPPPCAECGTTTA